MPAGKIVWIASMFFGLFGCGCGVERTMLIESDPPGAIVFLNDQEFGRTPARRDFTWYGSYDVAVRAEGYQTLKTNTWVVAPWWQWPPFDFFAELLPIRLKDQRRLMYTLEAADVEPVDPQRILSRAAELEGMLQSSRYRPPPGTRPAD